MTMFSATQGDLELLMQVPATINERVTTRFKYWENGIKEGINYRGKLYRFLRIFCPEDRLRAYDCGCQLNEAGLCTIISVKDSEYTLWVGLHSESQWNGQLESALLS